MLSRLPWTPKPKEKPRAVSRIAKHRRETITAAIMRILDTGEPTKFAFEGACHAGLRARLCLEGTAWPQADKFANEVVNEALRRIGASRPTWQEGSPTRRR